MRSGSHRRRPCSPVLAVVKPVTLVVALLLGSAEALTTLRAPVGVGFRPTVHRHAAAPLSTGPAASRRSRKKQRRGSSFVEMKQVGIVGATGAVGKELLGCLATREFPVSKLALFGSKGGQTVEVGAALGGTLEVAKFDVEALRGFDVVFLAASGDFAKQNAEAIAAVLAEGGVVIDNSSALRLKPGVPLVVPEVNGDLIKTAKLIANPNCTTAIAIMVLAPLFFEFGLKKVLVSTYQAASGAGAAGMAELKTGVAALNVNDETSSAIREDGCFDADKPFPNEVFAHPLPFNVIPHIDVFQDNLYTKEEMKVTWETKKILGFDPFDESSAEGEDNGSTAHPPKVSCTAVRIPTLRAHAEAIVVETERPVTPEKARAVLEAAPGVKVTDDPEHKAYPMPLTATGAYDVEVGRIRSNLVFGDHGLEFFVCGDQLLRGAALNAVLIAEKAIA